jgi:catecholate siderophore receptor
VFGGYTFMDSEQKNMGKAMSQWPALHNTPKHSFSLWTSYKPMAKLTLGLGIYAQSSVNASYASPPWMAAS